MIIAGDALERLRLMPTEIAHCCVTSPPYYGLRDYDVEGQIGLDPTPEAYVERMVEVFREVRRVLRSDGTFWLNIGDSYCSGTRSAYDRDNKSAARGGGFRRGNSKKNHKSNRDGAVAPNCKSKDLIGIPWMLAFALRADGWYLRQDIIWAKPNPMPESVTDRCTKAHEYIFLLSKSASYYFDNEAIKEPMVGEAHAPGNKSSGRLGNNGKTDNAVHQADRVWGSSGLRNKRSVWTVTTKPYKGAHFATFPPDLIEPCILAGTSERGVCPKCGAPWKRVVAKERHDGSSPTRNDGASKRGRGNDARNDSEDGRSHTTIETIGWRPACSCCNAGDPVPATVLDPFFGAGTTGLVAERLGRACIGIELNPAYALMAHRRIEAARPIKEAA